MSAAGALHLPSGPAQPRRRVLGRTYGMCVLQDFEALTPNLLARTLETVEGGGVVVLLLRTAESLHQLCGMVMDVHARSVFLAQPPPRASSLCGRYRTEAHSDLRPRFNERFLRSLRDMPSCLMLDDSLDILPWARQTLRIEPVAPDQRSAEPGAAELLELKASLEETQPVGSIVARCRTLDQAKAVLTFVEAISEKTLRSTISMTAGRGRGKSAALGLSIAAAVGYGYANIYVTSPSPENLNTLFEFVFKGFDAMGYEEHRDYELVQSSNKEFNKAIVRVNVFRESHRQVIQYIQPQDAHRLSQAELVVIDEAAAIPLALVQALFGPYLVFMGSTIRGYEGTGRSLSLKLLQQLRKDTAAAATAAAAAASAAGGAAAVATPAAGRALREVVLETPIRYAPGDPVEAWLDAVLCMNAADVTFSGAAGVACPVPSTCELYSVDRDALFSFNPVSELFLQRMMALYVASHYKNTPDDLQLLADAPAHRLFCLLGPVDPASQAKLPEVLCVLQVALEGEISKRTAQEAFKRGIKHAGDMIPWTLSQQYQDDGFPRLSGARVVRIATHPDYQGMGYGKRALEQLAHFYQGDLSSLGDGAPAPMASTGMSRLETLAPRENLPPLLNKLSQVAPERLDYPGVSFGVTKQLFKFWRRSGFLPLYVRQSRNELTGEHSAILVRPLNSGTAEAGWVDSFYTDFRRRLAALLGIAFRDLDTGLALGLLEAHDGSASLAKPLLRAAELDAHLSTFDQKRLHAYAQNLADYHVVMCAPPPHPRGHHLPCHGAHLWAAVTWCPRSPASSLKGGPMD